MKAALFGITPKTKKLIKCALFELVDYQFIMLHCTNENMGARVSTQSGAAGVLCALVRAGLSEK